MTGGRKQIYMRARTQRQLDRIFDILEPRGEAPDRIDGKRNESAMIAQIIDEKHKQLEAEEAAQKGE